MSRLSVAIVILFHIHLFTYDGSFILSLPVMQEGQVSVSGERMGTFAGERLRGLSLPRSKSG